MVSRLWGMIYMVLYRLVHQSLSAIWINGMPAFQGKVYITRIGPIVWTSESVCIIVVLFQGCLQGGVIIII